MKILLLGAKGNLGTAFLEIASNYGEHTFIGWDKDDIDVTDRALLLKKITDLQPEVIINTVAYNDVDGAEKNQESAKLAEELNCNLVKTLAEIAIEHKILLVHYSSDYVFSGEETRGYAEDAETAPLSVYGTSKAKGEREIISLSGRGLQWYLIRTARLFGKKGQTEHTKPSFFELMSELALKESELEVVNDESGSFTYTPDLAAATISLIESGDGYGIYHLVNEGEASWYQAVEYFFKKLGRGVKLRAVIGEVFARPARRPKHSRLLNTKRPFLRSWQSAIDEYTTKL